VIPGSGSRRPSRDPASPTGADPQTTSCGRGRTTTAAPRGGLQRPQRCRPGYTETRAASSVRMRRAVSKASFLMRGAIAKAGSRLRRSRRIGPRLGPGRGRLNPRAARRGGGTSTAFTSIRLLATWKSADVGDFVTIPATTDDQGALQVALPPMRELAATSSPRK